MSGEVIEAARALVLQPFMTAAHDSFLLVRRHREELERLFADGLGYRLVVEPKVARLFKAGLGRDASRPLLRRTGQRRAFEPRAYALLCLTLAALTRAPAQLLVDELVAQVRSAAADTDIAVDLDAVVDRRALAAVLLVLLDLGVLVERDGDLERWADTPGGEVTSLLDVRRDRLRLLVAASLSGARDPQDLLDTAALSSAAGGARVAVRRRLLESPVLSVTDLTDDQQEWWGKNRNREADWFRDRFGLELELRAEGAIAVDPQEELSDVAFPATGSARHAALLVLERLVREVREDARAAPVTDRVSWPVTEERLSAAVTAVVAEHGRGLRKAYADPAALRPDVVAVLSGMGLLLPGPRLHAAAARYAPQTTFTEGLF